MARIRQRALKGLTHTSFGALQQSNMPAVSFKQCCLPGYDPAYDENPSAPKTFGISTAVVIPASARIVTTSGSVGDVNGVFPESLEEQMRNAFQNAERALMHAVPEYETADNAWKSVFEVTSYHVGGVGPALPISQKLAEQYFGSHRPAWTAAGCKDLAFEGQLFELQLKALVP